MNQFGNELMNPFDYHNLIVKPSHALAGKDIILLYFSAYWCQQCRQFTSLLAKMYQKLVTKRSSSGSRRRSNSSSTRTRNVEVVFCSLDYERKEYEKYISNMPWLCMPYQSNFSKQMAKKYKAKGIPHLVVIDATNNYSIITSDAVSEIRSDKLNGGLKNVISNFPWRPKTFLEIWPDRIYAPIRNITAGEPPSKMMNSGFLRNKYLMLYFSAQWCPSSASSNAAAPDSYSLLQFYNQLKSQKREVDFELVFVSSDHTEESYIEYFKRDLSSFCCALPYNTCEQELRKKYAVQTVPTLLMLGPVNYSTGERPLINPNVSTKVAAIADFPFPIKHYGSIEQADTNSFNDQKCLLLLHENRTEEEQEWTKQIAMKVSQDVEDIQIYWSFEKDGMIGTKVRSVLDLSDASTEPTMVLLDLPDRGRYYCKKCVYNDNDENSNTIITVESIMNFLRAPGKVYQLD